jgi:hypothetical protein
VAGEEPEVTVTWARRLFIASASNVRGTGHTAKNRKDIHGERDENLLPATMSRQEIKRTTRRFSQSHPLVSCGSGTSGDYDEL